MVYLSSTLFFNCRLAELLQFYQIYLYLINQIVLYNQTYLLRLHLSLRTLTIHYTETTTNKFEAMCRSFDKSKKIRTFVRELLNIFWWYWCRLPIKFYRLHWFVCKICVRFVMIATYRIDTVNLTMKFVDATN